jgi:hypothetical protein
MDKNSIILSIDKPTIELEEIVVLDTSYGSGEHNVERSHRTLEVTTVEIPYIGVKGYTFTPNEIMMCEIDTTGFIPIITIKIETAGSTSFTSTAFPTDGDLVSIYLRGRDDLYVPIRNDYLITHIEMIKSNDEENISSRIIIEGKLNIPGLYDERTEAFDDTSYNVLRNIAKKLGLGFSTNIKSTDDKMKWLCHNISQEEFMKNITDCAWRDDKSFFTSYIDVYYNLNFINVNTQFADEDEALDGLSDSTILNYIKGDDPDNAKEKMKKVMTNHPQYVQSNYYVRSYKPLNKSSEIARTYGYTYNLNFFEHNSLKNWSFPVEPFITEGSEKSKVLLKGRPNENYYKTQQKFNFVGIQYSVPDHNVHEHYYLAKAQNMMNLAEIDKINLAVVCNKMNFNFIRFEKFPLIIVISKDTPRAAKLDADLGANQTDETLMSKEIVDKMYSGIYAIKGYKITYKKISTDGELKEPRPSALQQSFILTRREWPSLTGK